MNFWLVIDTFLQWKSSLMCNNFVCTQFTFVCSSGMETVSVPLLNKHLERATVGDINIYKHILPQSKCSLIYLLLFCVFFLRFKSSARHIFSKTTLTLTVWQCKMCEIHMGCFTNLDWTSSRNYTWIVPDLLSTFRFYMIPSLPSDFVSNKVPGKSDQCLFLLVD